MPQKPHRHHSPCALGHVCAAHVGPSTRTGSLAMLVSLRVASRTDQQKLRVQQHTLAYALYVAKDRVREGGGVPPLLLETDRSCVLKSGRTKESQQTIPTRPLKSVGKEEVKKTYIPAPKAVFNCLLGWKVQP